MQVNQILHGDALTKLRELEAESIDCCITSPPYWALRDYKTEGIVWDAVDGCEHDWNSQTYKIGSSNRNALGGSGITSCTATKEGFERSTGEKTSDFCSKCNAWKGSLGLEPTFDLYIKHLVEIFAEVKRVLKKTGSCWVNLGDTYAGTGHKGGARDAKNILGRNIDYAMNHKVPGIPEKSLCLIPQRFQIAMVDQGWICRNTIIWYKPNCMPSSAKDRFTVDFEYLFFFTKSQKYYFKTQYEPFDLTQPSGWRRQGAKFGGNKAAGYENAMYSGKEWIPKPTPMTEQHKKNAMSMGWDGVSDYADWYFNKREKRSWHDHSMDEEGGFGQQSRGQKPPLIPYPYGRIKRCVWKIPTQPFSDAHFATFPPELVETPLKATCPSEGIVLDPFMGSGTVALVALKNARNFIGIELNQSYIDMAMKRLAPLLQQTRL